MNIGILTFHWAPNYGAVLQTFALQEYLTSIGHNVEIVNFKPKWNDDTLINCIKYHRFKHPIRYWYQLCKEKALVKFRNSNLNLTKRIYSNQEIPNLLKGKDVIITGSDQVLTPPFLRCGEGKGIISPSYYLGFDFKGKKVAYAVSFGCVEYPQDMLPIAKKYSSDFYKIGVRENSGIHIFEQLGRSDGTLVPDPTLLMNRDFYLGIARKSGNVKREEYIYSFFIRNFKERKKMIMGKIFNLPVVWNNDEGHFALEDWLQYINYAKYVITDSFHCVVMAIKFHKQFIVVTEHEGNIGMNDRLFTLLGKLNLTERIIHKDSFVNSLQVLQKEVNWNVIDTEIEKFAKVGNEFLLSI